jgi:hypothetical protein
MMKAVRFAHVLMAATMFFATSAFAANKGSLEFQLPTMAGDAQLPAGDYTVQWDGTGPDVEVKIKSGSRVKATLPARVVPLGQPYKMDGVVIGTSDGGRKLLQIRFADKKYFLQIEPQTVMSKLPQSSPQSPGYQAALPQ